jgi:hypothetical protein
MDRLDPQPDAAARADGDAHRPIAENPTLPTADGATGTVAGGPPAGTFDPWSYRDDSVISGPALVGFRVEAADGAIGTIDSASSQVGASFLVVDTGPWIFGRRVVLPAGLVDHVDYDEEKVYIDRDRDQVKAAPEYDGLSHADPAYRDRLGGHYHP